MILLNHSFSHVNKPNYVVHNNYIIYQEITDLLAPNHYSLNAIQCVCNLSSLCLECMFRRFCSHCRRWPWTMDDILNSIEIFKSWMKEIGLYLHETHDKYWFLHVSQRFLNMFSDKSTIFDICLHSVLTIRRSKSA